MTNDLYMISITIAIPVYNVSRYVRKSLLSALNQDFIGEYEILVVDDCGTDDSMDIVRSVVKEHPRGGIVRIVEHAENMGLGPARNTAIDNARGEYIFFLDSDDWVSTDCLSVLYRRAEAAGSDITVGSLIRVEEDNPAKVKEEIFPDMDVNHEAAGVYLFTQGVNYNIELWNKLMRLSFIRGKGLTCVHRIIEDSIFDFNARALVQKVSLVSNVTLYYNIRKGSILTNIKQQGGSDESAFVFCDILKQCQHLINDRYASIPGIYDFYFLRILYSCISMYRAHYTDVQKRFIRKSMSGCMSFIPSAEMLSSVAYRRAWRLCRRRDDYEFFVRVWSYPDRSDFYIKYIYPVKLFLYKILH